MSDYLPSVTDRFLRSAELYHSGRIGWEGYQARLSEDAREARDQLRQRSVSAADVRRFGDPLADRRKALAARARAGRPHLAMQFKSAGMPLCYSWMAFKAASPVSFAAGGPDQGDSRFSETASADVGVPPGDARFGASKEGDGGPLDLYGMVWGNMDRQKDVALPGCVANIDEFLKAGWVSWCHQNDNLPVAVPVGASDDGRGFRVSAVWHDTAEARACKTVCNERLAAGKSVFSSVGYVVHRAEPEQRGDQVVRLLQSISVFEVAICLLSANPLAQLVSVGGPAGKGPQPERGFEGGYAFGG